MKPLILTASLLLLSCVSMRELRAAKCISYEVGVVAGIWYVDSLERRWDTMGLSDRDRESLRRGQKTLIEMRGR
jgi:hypothetical protein